MIPYKLALAAWFPVSVLLMADRNRARGFTLAMLGAMLLLPAKNAIVISGLPDLDRSNVAALGVLLGTIIFHTNSLLHFRPRLSDLLLVGVLAMAVATSIHNGFGAYDGLSTARTLAMSYLLPYFLARIHLETPRAIMTFLVALTVAAVVSAVPAIWEFRMSPQIHLQVYGYRTTSFATLVRGGFFRPTLFFSHALPLGRFFAFTAFLALFPLRPYLARKVPYGQFLFVLPLIGLIISMSWSPYLLFILLCAGYLVARRRHYLVYALPAAAGLWLVGVFAGLQPGYGIVDTIARYNPSRADSLKYRLDALEEYRVRIVEQPLLGYGGWNNARTRRATDSAFLITSLSRGLGGSILYYGWWVWLMHIVLRMARNIRGTPFGDICFSVGLLMAICLAICAVDNALDTYLPLLAGGILAIEGVYRTNPAAFRPRTARAPVPHTVTPMYVYPR